MPDVENTTYDPATDTFLEKPSAIKKESEDQIEQDVKQLGEKNNELVLHVDLAMLVMMYFSKVL